MPRYEVTLAAGLDFPLGFEFDSDNLHPCMRQHVRQVGKSAEVAADDKNVDDDKPLTKAQLDKLHAEALKADAARTAEAKKAAEGGGGNTGPANGPGENS